MKVLFLQLARLGDIYQTWPVIRAYQRQNPAAEIHFLTRAKFSEAAKGLSGIAKHWSLDTKKILGPLISERPSLDQSIVALTEMCESLKAEKFDHVINLSFSPVSSFLVGLVSSENTEVHGYKRHSDGYFAVADDPSAYFYAQVGPVKANRLHLTEIFAQIAGCGLEDSDWDVFNSSFPRGKNIVVHVGASDARKSFGTHRWLQVVKGLLEQTDYEVTLIGSKEEMDAGYAIAGVTSERKPRNLVGHTNLVDLFELIGTSELLIGADSAPIHIASLTKTPVLNLSFGSVNFWETGPKAVGSRILYAETEDSLGSDSVVLEALTMLKNSPSTFPAVEVNSRRELYVDPKNYNSSVWEMVTAVYMGYPFPKLTNETFVEGHLRLSEVNELALQQIGFLRANPQNQASSSILDRCDEIMETIGRYSPELGVIVRWFQTERIRIAPADREAVLNATQSIHTKLAEILNLYSTKAAASLNQERAI